jgi:hypothetical protein
VGDEVEKYFSLIKRFSTIIPIKIAPGHITGRGLQSLSDILE